MTNIHFVAAGDKGKENVNVDHDDHVDQQGFPGGMLVKIFWRRDVGITFPS
ncbi:MAG TPA: hypothetical protein VFS88_06030 [Micavibrio sp.]|nr:hypothetical protein [Micavibrio sp.]